MAAGPPQCELAPWLSVRNQAAPYGPLRIGFLICVALEECALS